MLTYRDNFADLLRAVDALAITDPAGQVAIARMLGLRAAFAAPIPAPSSRAVKPEPQTELALQPTPSPAVTSPPPQPPNDAIDSRDDAWLERLSSAGASLPAWFDGVEAFPEQDTTPQHTPPPIESLFRAQWTRALIHEALCTTSPTGEIDIERAIATLAGARPMTSWPHRERRRLHRGVQVLIDCNESLRPYALDQTQLLSRIREVVGREIVQAMTFIGCPSRVLQADGFGETAYQPPRRGTPILVLTDFGVSAAGIRGRDASLAEWLQFLAAGREAGCPVVALAPYPAERIPPAIRQAIAVVTWDRSTTTVIVRHLRDKAGIDP